MEAREIAIAQARGRIALGGLLLLAPGLAGRAWVGGDADRPGAKLLARGLGARDVGIGLGIVIALDRGAPVRGWLEASALADAVDFAATLIARDEVPAATLPGILAMAGGSTVLSGWLARQLDPPPEAEPGQELEAALTGHPEEGVGA